jgi:DNA-binding transcriptional MerR regulator
MSARVYKIKDLALRIDRTILTIKRWEKRGLLPAPRKDSRGWRVYTEAEVKEIIKRVQETNYFQNHDQSA